MRLAIPNRVILPGRRQYNHAIFDSGIRWSHLPDPPQQCRDRVDHHAIFIFGVLHFVERLL